MRGFDFNEVLNRLNRDTFSEQLGAQLYDTIKYLENLEFKLGNEAQVLIREDYLKDKKYGILEPLEKILDKKYIKKVDEIIRKIKKIVHVHTDLNIPNWNWSLDKIIKDTEVWILAEEDIIKGKNRRNAITVRNRFTNEKEDILPTELFPQRIPNITSDDIRKIKDIEDEINRRLEHNVNLNPNTVNPCLIEKTLPELEEELLKSRKELWGEENYFKSHDWLGCYSSKTGTIFLRIELIHNIANAFGYDLRTVMQKVLLHEFIHACLDLWPRDAEGKIICSRKKWTNEILQKKDGICIAFNEESVDNAIVLQAYKNDTESYDVICNLISHQPYYYRNAIVMDEANSYIEGLDYNLSSLVQYKVSIGLKSLVPVIEEVMPIYSPPQGGFDIHIKSIGILAYAVYAMIINKNKFNLNKILSTNKVFDGKYQDLCIIGEKELNNKNERRYYKIPLISKDGAKVFVSSQWKEKHYNILNQLVKMYLN